MFKSRSKSQQKQQQQPAKQFFFNPEDYISEKRAWTHRNVSNIHTSGDDNRQSDDTAAAQRLFDHFLVVGLAPTTNVRKVTADIKTFYRSPVEGFELTPETPKNNNKRYGGLKGPSLPAEVLYSFPDNNGVDHINEESDKDHPSSSTTNDDIVETIAAFCHPHGVRPELLERTPSMSALNEVIYSQSYQTSDTQSFVFTLKGSSQQTLYAVCCYVKELLHRPPTMARSAYPECTAPLSRYMVVAPRCYCLVSRYPFFSLHFRVLSTLLGLERLDRVAALAAELSSGVVKALPSPSSLSSVETGDGNGGGGGGDSGVSSAARNSDNNNNNNGSGLAYTTPAHLGRSDSITTTASSRSSITNDDIDTATSNVQSVSNTVTSKFSRLTLRKSVLSSGSGYTALADSAPSTPVAQQNDNDDNVGNEGSDNNQSTPFFTPAPFILKTTCSSRSIEDNNNSNKLPSKPPAATIDSPTASSSYITADDSSSLPQCTMTPTELLEAYYSQQVPNIGEEAVFQPDPSLQTITYTRDQQADMKWTVAALCRSMSLENVLLFITAALLERQMVVFCPNIGLLSGIVLSLMPLLEPFSWQSLMLPVLPVQSGGTHLELMEAPVPFILGCVYKTQEVRLRSMGVIRVNVYKNKVKNAVGLPQLPYYRELYDALSATHAELRKLGTIPSASSRPIHVITEAQQVLAESFLDTLQKYLLSLVIDLKGYTITDVSSSEAAEERVGVLLKESFVDHFPLKERQFMKNFVDTQMFAMYCDTVL
jgi:hypothetical protein